MELLEFQGDFSVKALYEQYNIESNGQRPTISTNYFFNW